MDKRVEAACAGVIAWGCGIGGDDVKWPDGVSTAEQAELREFMVAALAAADAVSSPVPDGLVLVPKEPTDDMCLAGYEAPAGSGHGCDNMRELARSHVLGCYRAMLAAAPKAPALDEAAIRADERERLAKAMGDMEAEKLAEAEAMGHTEDPTGYGPAIEFVDLCQKARDYAFAANAIRSAATKPETQE